MLRCRALKRQWFREWEFKRQRVSHVEVYEVEEDEIIGDWYLVVGGWSLSGGSILTRSFLHAPASLRG